MLELIGLTLLGTITGTITGLLPGIHPNTVIFTSLPLLVTIPPRTALPVIVTAAVSHSVLNHIPAILIGVPDEGSALTALPGKEMVLQGKASHAIQATLGGGLHTAATSVLLVPIALVVLPTVYPLVRPYLIYLISAILGSMVIVDERPGTALGITLLCGLVGIATLSSPLPGSEALFPLFLGLFGLPVLLATTDGAVPDQDHTRTVPSSTVANLVGSIAGLLSGILPGLGPAATVALFDRVLDRRQFMIALGGINTGDAVFSIVALFTIGNPRSGASVAVQKLIEPTVGTGVLVLGCGLTGIATAYSIGQAILPDLLAVYPRLDHRRIALGTAAALIALTLPVSGIGGFAVLAAATGAGLLAQQQRVRKSLCMSCLIVPFLLQEVGLTL